MCWASWEHITYTSHAVLSSTEGRTVTSSRGRNWQWREGKLLAPNVQLEVTELGLQLRFAGTKVHDLKYMANWLPGGVGRESSICSP